MLGSTFLVLHLRKPHKNIVLENSPFCTGAFSLAPGLASVGVSLSTRRQPLPQPLASNRPNTKLSVIRSQGSRHLCTFAYWNRRKHRLRLRLPKGTASRRRRPVSWRSAARRRSHRTLARAAGATVSIPRDPKGHGSFFWIVI